MNKTTTIITASVVTGVVIGSAVGAIIKTTRKRKPKSLLKRSADLALEAVGEVFHGIAHIG